jgi:hypothetical protein
MTEMALQPSISSMNAEHEKIGVIVKGLDLKPN